MLQLKTGFSLNYMAIIYIIFTIPVWIYAGHKELENKLNIIFKNLNPDNRYLDPW